MLSHVMQDNNFERINKNKSADWAYEKERQESKKKARESRQMKKNKREQWQTAD